MTKSSINYNDLSYPNYVFSDTHPSRLAAIGRFFGLDSPNSQKARVLEIGCAGGLNLLSHACALPNAKFVGIDASSEQIKAALELQKLAGITNLEFLCQKVESLQASSGEFDYIICHGVFSWVSKHVQHEILKTCRSLLSENGIAYISYNTLPGWHIQRIIRDALLYRSQGASSAEDLGEISKEFLNFSKDLFPKAAQPLLNPTIEHLLKTPDSYLAHEHLAEENTPLYFHEFLQLLQQHGLMYLAESELGSMIPKEYEPEVQDKIVELAGGSLSKMEQYCDFFRLRQFRKTLICRDSCRPQRQLDPERLKPLYLTAAKSHLSKDYKCKDEAGAENLAGLSKKFPGSLSVNDLLEGNQNSESLDKLIELVMLDLIELRDSPCPMRVSVSGLESLSPLVNALIKFGNVVPNLRSDTVALSDSLHRALQNGSSLSQTQYAELCALGLMRE